MHTRYPGSKTRKQKIKARHRGTKSKNKNILNLKLVQHMTTYKSAGVNIEAGNALVKKIKRMAPGIGGFSGTFPLYKKKYQNPLLVASSDGVGTKLKIANLLNQHNTIGIDLVAMNVNDLICCGAEPLFFLDYFSTSTLNVRKAGEVIQGIVHGCRLAGCVLLGGETAEMPGFYKKGEYDIAGFSVGIVEKKDLIDGKKIQAGDCVVGIPSSGLHSNGFSLVRKVFGAARLKQYGKELIKPTRIYCRDILSVVRTYTGIIKGIVHITGGGFYDNIPRIVPDKKLQVVIDKQSWKVPEIFRKIQSYGNVPEKEMYRTFNMGIGMVLIIHPRGWRILKKKIRDTIKLGTIEKGNKGVVLL